MPTTILCSPGPLTPMATWWKTRQSRTSPGFPGIAGHGIRTAAPATLYVCGGAANELELADRFTHVFLLEMDEPTMLARLDAPSRDNEWGRIGDTREHLRRRLPGHQDRLRAFGAIPIDARQALDQVVDAILSHTLASSATSQASKPSNQPAR
jgi:hypothetical protein